MKEIDKVLANTKEVIFLRYLDFYADAEVVVTRDGNNYNYQFEATEIDDAVNVNLRFDNQGRLKEVHCDCQKDDEDDGYCVHEFAAYIEYYKAKHQYFDILHYVISRQQEEEPDDIWLESIDNYDMDDFDDYDDFEDFEKFDDFNFDHSNSYGFLKELGMSPDEIDEIANFDIGLALEEMSKEEIIEKMREICNTYPLVHFAIVQHLALSFFEEHLKDFEDEDLDDVESFLSALNTTNRKPS